MGLVDQDACVSSSHELSGGYQLPNTYAANFRDKTLVGEVVLGLKLIWSIVKTERELADVDLTDRTRVHGVRVLALASRFGINQVCMFAGGTGGAAAGTVVPGVGNVAGGLGGALAGFGGAMMLNRRLEPRIEEVAMKIVGGDSDDLFYLMNRVEIDRIGESLAATRAA